MSIPWAPDTQAKFQKLLEKIPVFLRDTANEKVGRCAEKFAQDSNQTEITERILVDAFFKETPFGFHGPMKADMQSVGIDYQKYGYDR